MTFSLWGAFLEFFYAKHICDFMGFWLNYLYNKTEAKLFTERLWKYSRSQKEKVKDVKERRENSLTEKRRCYKREEELRNGWSSRRRQQRVSSHPLYHEHKTSSLNDFDVVHCRSMILTVYTVHCTVYIVHYTLCVHKTLSTMNIRRSLVSQWFQRCTHRCTWVYKLITL